MKKQLLLFTVITTVSVGTMYSNTHKIEANMKELQAAHERFKTTGKFNSDETRDEKNMKHLQSQGDRFKKTPIKKKYGWAAKRQQKRETEAKNGVSLN